MRGKSAIVLILAAAAGVMLAGCGGSDGQTVGPTVAAGVLSPPALAGARSDAETLQAAFVRTVRTVSTSVVEVETPVGLGSGIVLDTRGDVVTNNHVVGKYKRFLVTDAAGRRYHATLVGKFPPDDVAVIHVSGARLAPAAIGDSSRLRVGDIVFAVGNPLGLQSSVTQGIVSALGRTVSESSGTALPDTIQTSASINPGNSGGALADLSGEVVGIPTLAAIDPENEQLAGGIGFAVPSNTFKAIAAQLIRYGRVVRSGRAYLGVRLSTPLSGGGVEVVSVERGGAAAASGIVAGDRILSIGGQPVATIDDVAATLAGLQPGATVKVVVRTSGGTSSTVRVKLDEYPGS